MSFDCVLQLTLECRTSPEIMAYRLRNNTYILYMLYTSVAGLLFSTYFSCRIALSYVLYLPNCFVLHTWFAGLLCLIYFSCRIALSYLLQLPDCFVLYTLVAGLLCPIYFTCRIDLSYILQLPDCFVLHNLVAGLLCLIYFSCRIDLSYILQLPNCFVLYTLVAGLLARSQYPEGPATRHLGTDFLGFPVSVYKRMLRWFPRLQVATACFSCSPSDLNFSVPYFIFMYMHNNHCHQVTAQLQLI